MIIERSLKCCLVVYRPVISIYAAVEGPRVLKHSVLLESFELHSIIFSTNQLNILFDNVVMSLYSIIETCIVLGG